MAYRTRPAVSIAPHASIRRKHSRISGASIELTGRFASHGKYRSRDDSRSGPGAARKPRSTRQAPTAFLFRRIGTEPPVTQPSRGPGQLCAKLADTPKKYPQMYRMTTDGVEPRRITKNPQRLTRSGFPDVRGTPRTEFWWAPRESNPAPTDYAYHYGFRHPFRVCGLDCLLSLRPARTVSTRSLCESFARDRHAAASIATTAEVSPNLSSSTRRQSELTPRQPNRRVRTPASRRTQPAKSAALTRHELEALKLNAANKKTRS